MDVNMVYEMQLKIRLEATLIVSHSIVNDHFYSYSCLRRTDGKKV